VLVALYVDDFFVFHNSPEEACKLKNVLKQNFRMKDLGPAAQVLNCMEIKRDVEKKTLKISQTQFIKDLLHKFGMSDSNPIGTPLDVNVKLSRAKDIDNKPYQQLIGSLMYLSVCTRPDITYALSYLSQFNSYHGEEHWVAAKRVLRYLKGTMNQGLEFKSTGLNLKGFADASFATDDSDCKSYTGYVFKLANCAVTWEARKQSTVATSSTEAEYVALSEAAKEAVYLKNLVCDLIGSSVNPIKIEFIKGESDLIRLMMHDKVELYNDNQSAQKIANNPVYHKRTKHINNKHHFIREKVQEKLISLVYM
jgi:hypothetical protein